MAEKSDRAKKRYRVLCWITCTEVPVIALQGIVAFLGMLHRPQSQDP